MPIFYKEKYNPKKPLSLLLRENMKRKGKEVFSFF